MILKKTQGEILVKYMDYKKLNNFLVRSQSIDLSKYYGFDLMVKDLFIKE